MPSSACFLFVVTRVVCCALCTITDTNNNNNNNNNGSPANLDAIGYERQRKMTDKVEAWPAHDSMADGGVEEEIIGWKWRRDG